MRRKVRGSREGKILALAGFTVLAVAVVLSLRIPREKVPSLPAPAPAPAPAPSSHPVFRSVRRKDVAWFLKKTRISDFDSELGQSVGLSEGELAGRFEWIEGCQEGIMALEDGRKWQVTTEISGQDGGGANVVLSEGGSVFLNSIGSDGARDLRTLAGPSGALVLEASENIFLQLYPIRDSGGVAGNAYLRSGNGKLGFGGTVLLKKRACPSD